MVSSFFNRIQVIAQKPIIPAIIEYFKRFYVCTPLKSTEKVLFACNLLASETFLRGMHWVKVIGTKNQFLHVLNFFSFNLLLCTLKISIGSGPKWECLVCMNKQAFPASFNRFDYNGAETIKIYVDIHAHIHTCIHFTSCSECDVILREKLFLYSYLQFLRMLNFFLLHDYKALSCSGRTWETRNRNICDKKYGVGSRMERGFSL